MGCRWMGRHQMRRCWPWIGHSRIGWDRGWSPWLHLHRSSHNMIRQLHSLSRPAEIDLCQREEMKSVVGPLLIDDTTLNDDAKIGAVLRDQITTTYHPAGTAPMGLPGDQRAVVDAQGRVHGIEGLRVVDASIMPTSVRSNTNLTCVMLAERIAAWIMA